MTSGRHAPLFSPRGRAAILSGLVCAAALWSALAPAQEWSYYGATQAGMRYSALAQIDRSNVADLELAWTYRTGDAERYGDKLLGIQSFENTPTLVEGSLIVCSSLGRVAALDPATGRERWVFDPNAKLKKIPWEKVIIPKCRGVSPWLDRQAPEGAQCRHRILYGTWQFKVYALDVRTGRPCSDFGTGGEVSLDSGRALDPDEYIVIPAPPAIVGDLAIFGTSISDSVRADSLSGKVRALDARTGAMRWEFDPIVRAPVDPAAKSWTGDGTRRTGNGNVWTMMSVDEVRDLVFLPTSSPSPDYYGGMRPGENRYADSLVALRGSTGELVWHFQITHHNLWDYDLPAQPILVDLPHAGRTVPAVVQLTKQGLVFVFNRETGEPLFPIEERPVPQGGVEGEWLSPTQPFPVAPPPLVAQGVGPENAWGVTLIDRWLCRRKIEALRHGPIYTPPSLEGSIVMPSVIGGANWGGGAVDPEHHLLLVNTQHTPSVLTLVPGTGQADPGQDLPQVGAGADVEKGVFFPQRGAPYSARISTLVSPLGAPCTAPPWGRLTAVDLARGTIRWQVPLGTIEKIAPIPLPLAWGTPNVGGAIVTAGGLVFIAATVDDKFRAFDIDTGGLVWETRLPAGGQATPMTYAVDSRQYLVIAAGGHAVFQGTPGDYFLAYTLKPRDH